LRRLEREKSRRTANRPCRSTRPVGRRWLGAASRAQSIAVQHASERTEVHNYAIARQVLRSV
jgi:hypothetical protein